MADWNDYGMSVTKTSVKASARRLVAISEARTAVLEGRVRQARERARLSQAEFGEAIGVQPAAVSRWESGQRLPRGDVAERLTHLLREIEAATPIEPSEVRKPVVLHTTAPAPRR